MTGKKAQKKGFWNNSQSPLADPCMWFQQQNSKDMRFTEISLFEDISHKFDGMEAELTTGRAILDPHKFNF